MCVYVYIYILFKGLNHNHTLTHSEDTEFMLEKVTVFPYNKLPSTWQELIIYLLNQNTHIMLEMLTFAQ